MSQRDLEKMPRGEAANKKVEELIERFPYLKEAIEQSAEGWKVHEDKVSNIMENQKKLAQSAYFTKKLESSYQILAEMEDPEKTIQYEQSKKIVKETQDEIKALEQEKAAQSGLLPKLWTNTGDIMEATSKLDDNLLIVENYEKSKASIEATIKNTQEQLDKLAELKPGETIEPIYKYEMDDTIKGLVGTFQGLQSEMTKFTVAEKKADIYRAKPKTEEGKKAGIIAKETLKDLGVEKPSLDTKSFNQALENILSTQKTSEIVTQSQIALNQTSGQLVLATKALEEERAKGAAADATKVANLIAEVETLSGIQMQLQGLLNVFTDAVNRTPSNIRDAIQSSRLNVDVDLKTQVTYKPGASPILSTKPDFSAPTNTQIPLKARGDKFFNPNQQEFPHLLGGGILADLG